jgi:beta-fructofuranosidase
MLIENQLVVKNQYQKQALEYLDQGQFSQAIAIYQKSVEADPNIISNYWYLGLALLLERKKAEAQAVWLSAMTQIQTDQIDFYIKELVDILENTAFRYLHSGSLTTAETIYLEILELDPSSLKSYINLGAIFTELNNLNAASDCFHKALEIDPNCAEAHFNLGFLFEIQGELEKAIPYFCKAIEIQPNFRDAHRKLRLVQETLRSREAGYALKIGLESRIWDPWLFKDGDIYRLFYLTSDQKSRHFWFTGEVGAATSTDMKKWNYLGRVHKPHPSHEWENGRILAGNVYKENGIYYLFYSASPAGIKLLDEKIGLVTSVDGEHWQRRTNFLLQPDPHFYAPSCNFQITGEEEININEHRQWRDPYIVKEPLTGKYYMFITAAAARGNPYFRGCIALAVADKIDGPYEVLPPVAYPVLDRTDESIFYEMERPQVIYKHHKYHLFFSARCRLVHQVWLDQIGRQGISDSSLYWFVADNITGPFLPAKKKPVVKGSEKTSLYGTNFIEDPNGQLIAYGWYTCSYTLEVSPRFPVRWNEDSIEILVDEHTI